MKKIKQIPALYWAVLVTPLIMLDPLLRPGKAMFWGTPMLQFVPWWTQAWRTLQIGQIPLWNPLVGLGAPLLANYQTALLYPPTWLLFAFAAIGDVPALAYGIGWLIALHLIWTGVGMILLTREMGWSQLAQVVSALAFSMSGYLVARTHFPSMVFAAAWVPWILWAAYRFAHQRNRKTILSLSLFTSLQLLTGHAQTAWYTIIFVAVWIAFWVIRNKNEGWKQQLWRALLGYAAAGLWAVLMAAAQLVPTAEYLWLSQRSAEVDFELAMTYSFWPWRLLGLIAPNMFGNPAHGDYWGYVAFWEDDIYIGFIALMLVFLVLFHKHKTAQQKTFTRFILVISVVGFIFALGKNTPIFPFLYQYIPTFDMFKSPTRYMLWGEIGLALLAGLGIQLWQRPEGRGLYRSRLALAGAFAVTIGAGLGALLLSQLELDLETMRPTFVPALALAGIWGISFGWLNLKAPEKGKQPLAWWSYAVVGFLALDLIIAGWGLNPAIDSSFYAGHASSYSDIATLTEGHRIYMPPETEYDLTYERFLDFSSFTIDESWTDARAAMLPNLPMLDSLPMVNNFDPLVPEKYAILMERLDNGEIPYKFLDIGVVIESDADFNGVASSLDKEANRTHWLTPTANVKIEWIEDTPNRLQLRVTTDGAGALVVSDLNYPGWQATINGEEVEIHDFLSALRLVDVPAGENEIIFEYRPSSFYIGLALSFIAWSTWGYMGWHAKKQTY